MKHKTLKSILAMSLSIGVLSGQFVDIAAKELATTGIKTEYQMQDLNRKPQSAELGGNLVLNGDFEQGNVSWSFKKKSHISKWGGSNGYDKSLWYGVLESNHNDSVIYQTVKVKPHTDYVLKSKVMLGRDGAKAILAAKANDLASTVAEMNVLGTTANLWQYQDAELRFNSGDHTQIQVAVMKWTEQTSGPIYESQVHIDNVELYEVSTSGGLLSNGEFSKDQQWDKKNATIDGTQAILSGNSSDSNVSQLVTLSPNTNYTIKAKVKLEHEGAQAFLAVKNRDLGNLNPGIQTTVTATKDTVGKWQDVTFEFNSGNNSEVRVAFMKWLDKADLANPTYTSKMYIDSISLMPNKTSEPTPQEEYEVVWADEFNGKGHTDKNGLNISDWGYELGSIRGVEQQHYTKDRENVRVENGKLILEVTNRDKENQYKNPRGDRQVIYNSGSVRTHGKKEFLFGRIEVLAKLPHGQATFPAFWTLGADFPIDGDINSSHGDGWPLSGEIDIMESIGDKNVVYQTLHYSDINKPNYSPGADNGAYAGNGKTTAITTKGQVINGETYHVFGINWSKGKIEWYIDDQIVRSVDYSNDPAAMKALDRPQYIQLNFATGGNWPGDAGTNLAGQTFEIEYAYYAQNQEQKAQAKEWYDNTVSINANDLTMVEGTTPDLLKDVTLTEGSNKVNKNEFTLDYSIDDEYLFTTNKDLTDRHPSNDKNETDVKLRVKNKLDTESLSKLEPGEYNLHISALHDSKVSVRKTVKLTIEAKADYTKVDAAIEKAEALVKENYVDFTKVEEAIDAVVRNKGVSEQAVVDGYATAIENAITALQLMKADYTKVDEAIKKAEALVKENYVDFTKVEEAINAVVRDLDITKQAVVDGYATAIINAIDALVEKEVVTPTVVDKTKLEALVNEVSKLDSKEYTTESYSLLKEALVNANDVLKDTQATQKVVDDAYNALLKAKEGLVKVGVVTPQPPVNNETQQKPTPTGDVHMVEMCVASMLLACGGIFISMKKRKQND